MRIIAPRWLAGTIIAATAVRSLAAQQNVPVITLPAASVATRETLGSVLGIREVPGGRLLVNDADRRQVRLFDSTLAISAVVIDSVAGTSSSYGRRPAPLIAYLGDSTLFPDYSSRTLLVLDAMGHVARAMALPTPNDVGLVRRGSGIDARGRLLYLGNAAQAPDASRDGDAADSVPILRADFDLRRTDTLGRIARPLAKVAAETPDGRAVISIWTLDPLRTIDEWAALSDGSVAFVRGHDYHVDWIRPNGSATSTPKLPFDWKRLEDDDRRRIFDSTRTQLARAAENGTIVEIADMISIVRKSNATLPPMGGATPGGGRSGSGSGPGGGSPLAGLKLLPLDGTQLDRVPDYYPPIRTGAALADRDGRLWILPTTSAQSKQGELVYDVVDANGTLVHRVRAPLGRLIVGFGTGGVVYMVAGNRASGFTLERSRLAAPPRP